MTIEELAKYSKLSVRQLRKVIARAFNPLPSYLVAGRRLVRQDEYDAWAMGTLSNRRKPKPTGEKRIVILPESR
jgi:hypothetical protein